MNASRLAFPPLPPRLRRARPRAAAHSAADQYRNGTAWRERAAWREPLHQANSSRPPSRNSVAVSRRPPARTEKRRPIGSPPPGLSDGAWRQEPAFVFEPGLAFSPDGGVLAAAQGNRLALWRVKL